MFAALVAAWCPLVVDFALAALPARRRKLLKAAAKRYALESGSQKEAIVKAEESSQEISTKGSLS